MADCTWYAEGVTRQKILSATWAARLVERKLLK